jgi:hypothetical protein
MSRFMIPNQRLGRFSRTTIQGNVRHTDLHRSFCNADAPDGQTRT